ncbi:MAG TPA: transcriptional regulator NrdR [Thermoanaerobacterales bacterium]|nr:transcriptional regulator NrdR [Thermoanaerobacterales bacterium]
MKCPYCGYTQSKVIDSRPTDEGAVIRRRRECLDCEQRFTTYEKIEELPLIVIKKDGRREIFKREKILKGLIKACEKRPISLETLDKIVNKIETELKNTMEREVTSKQIGGMVMEYLKGFDEVAYVRFASVYREFKDINTFMEEIRKILQKNC